jgi:hypothetical protein
MFLFRHQINCALLPTILMIVGRLTESEQEVWSSARLPIARAAASPTGFDLAIGICDHEVAEFASRTKTPPMRLFLTAMRVSPCFTIARRVSTATR